VASDDKIFVGRQGELMTLESHLLPESLAIPFRAAFLHGQAGIGKTALVAEFVRRHHDHFPAGIRFLSASAPGQEVSERLGDIDSLVGDLHPQGPGLVVLEDAEHANPVLTGTAVRELRQRRPQTRVILTARQHLSMPVEWLDVPVGDLPTRDMEALLQIRAGRDVNGIRDLASRMQGSPFLASLIAQMAKQGAGLAELLGRLEPGTYTGLTGPDGRALSPGAEPPELVGGKLRAVNADLVAQVKLRPELMRELTPRQFEEFVAELYERHGFKVELTPASRDGGVDLFAVRYEAFGKFLTVVDCKRYAPHRPVEVRLVRQLHGVVEETGASAGVLATTSSFTKGAKELQERNQYRLALQDWFDLQDMLRRVN
jgi:restriction system protein